MAGNTIYMQKGSNYIDIHDNEVVNLNVDKGTVSIDKGEITQGKAKGKGGRPRRSGKKINKAFIYDAGEETNQRLQLLYNGLKALNWIREDSDLKSFMSLFSGGETRCRLVWTGEVNALTELFKELVTRRKLVKLPKGESIWIMVNARFWNKEGNREFGSDKLRMTKAPTENKENIDTLVMVMNPNTSVEELKKAILRQQ